MIHNIKQLFDCCVFSFRLRWHLTKFDEIVQKYAYVVVFNIHHLARWTVQEILNIIITQYKYHLTVNYLFLFFSFFSRPITTYSHNTHAHIHVNIRRDRGKIIFRRIILGGGGNDERAYYKYCTITCAQNYAASSGKCGARWFTGGDSSAARSTHPPRAHYIYVHLYGIRTVYIGQGLATCAPL